MHRKDYLQGIRISFDKKVIRQNIYNFSFREARRLHEFIYDALLKELYEDYCLVTAKYFECLVAKENKLLKDGTIRDRVSDEPELLLGLYDKCKTAEKVLNNDLNNGKQICTRLLLQCLYWCDDYRGKYDWVVHEMHNIIQTISSRLHKKSAENIEDKSYCLILYKSAKLSLKYNVPLTIKLLRKAFDIAQGTTWAIKVGNITDDAMLVSLTKATAESLAEASLKNAYDIVQSDASQSIKNAQNALQILAKSNFHPTSEVFLLAYLDLAYFFIEDGRYEEAVHSLEQIKYRLDGNKTDSEKYMLMWCKYYHFAGICYDRVHKKELALTKHLNCIAIAHEANLEEYKARSLLELAKIYSTFGNLQSRMAEKCLNEAKIMFSQQNNYTALKICKFVQVKNKALFVQPMVCDLIKRSIESQGDRLRLLEWKARCVPFWRNIHKAHDLEESNPARFVLFRWGEDPLLQTPILNNYRRKLPIS